MNSKSRTVGCPYFTFTSKSAKADLVEWSSATKYPVKSSKSVPLSEVNRVEGEQNAIVNKKRAQEFQAEKRQVIAEALKTPEGKKALKKATKGPKLGSKYFRKKIKDQSPAVSEVDRVRQENDAKVIADIQKQLEQVVNGPNLTITSHTYSIARKLKQSLGKLNASPAKLYIGTAGDTGQKLHVHGARPKRKK
jgi:hypothetical protein